MSSRKSPTISKYSPAVTLNLLDRTEMKGLLRSMIQPDPVQRITARDAHQHPALAIDVNTDMSTPPFVRTAASLPLEPKEKKQVPREKRDQKRSQALQAETGAKFIKSNNKTRTKQVEKAGEKGATEAYALAALAQHREIQPSTRASLPVTKPDLLENAKSIPVDGERASVAYCDDAGAMGVASAAPVVKLSDDAAEAVLVPASQERGYLYDAKAVEPTVSTGKQNKLRSTTQKLKHLIHRCSPIPESSSTRRPRSSSTCFCSSIEKC